MTGSGSVPMLDTCDADAIAAATLACPAVAGLHEGGTLAVATYLPRRRVVGVRVEDQRVLVSVVLAFGSSVQSLERQVRNALSPLVVGRRVDVHVADVQLPGNSREQADPHAFAR